MPSLPGNYQRPSGSGYTRYEDLQVSDIRTAFHNVPNGTALTLPAGTFTFSDFADPQGYKDGIRATKYTTGWSGSGIDQTILQMVANSGTYVPPTAAGSSNVANLLAIYTDGSSKPALTIEGFTLRGTRQSTTQYYNGLQVAYAVNPVIRNVFFDGCSPGYSNFPPGETDQLSTYYCTGALVQNCIFDGKGIAASPLAANYDTNVTWDNCTVYCSAGSSVGMPTNYATNGLTTHNLVSKGGSNGMNHEECGQGAIRHYNPTLMPDRASTPTAAHMSFASTSQTGNNSDIEIHWDNVTAPLVDVYPGANGCFVYVIPDSYSSSYGSGQAQTSLPKVYLNGTLLSTVDVPAGQSISNAYNGTPNPKTTVFRLHG